MKLIKMLVITNVAYMVCFFVPVIAHRIAHYIGKPLVNAGKVFFTVKKTSLACLYNSQVVHSFSKFQSRFNWSSTQFAMEC
jgi:hypothetical protein